MRPDHSSACGAAIVPGEVPCSVNVLTHNSAKTLDAALRSVSDFAEIIVSDGDSDDATVAVAIRHGARVIRQNPAFTDERGRLQDYAAARSQLLSASTRDWILYLDSDEVLAPGTSGVLFTTLSSEVPEEVGAFRLNGHHVIDDELIDDGIGYPMRMERVFRRSALQGFQGFINEQGVLAPGYIVANLDAAFLIPLPPLRTVARKWMRYVGVLAREARQQGPEWTARQIVIRRSSIRWVSEAWVSARRRRSPHRVPARYEVGRLGFAVSQYVAVVAVRASQRVTRVR